MALAGATATVNGQLEATGRIPAGSTLELDLPTPAAPAKAAQAMQRAGGSAGRSAEAGAAEDAEEEEAFLEAVTGQRGAAVAAAAEAQQTAVLLVRPEGSAEWAVTCALQPGARCTSGVPHASFPATQKLSEQPVSIRRLSSHHRAEPVSCGAHAGGVLVSVRQQAAMLHVRLEENSQSAESARAADNSSNLHITVAVECLQVSMWDDERGRLRGQAPTLAPAAQETFCLYVDGLKLQLSSRQGPLSDAAAPGRELSMQMDAQGLQIDSYLPGSSHPVLCRSEAAGSASADSLPLQLTLQVGATCTNMWLHGRAFGRCVKTRPESGIHAVWCAWLDCRTCHVCRCTKATRAAVPGWPVQSCTEAGCGDWACACLFWRWHSTMRYLLLRNASHAS